MQYLYTVIRDGDLAAIGDFFDGDELDLDDVTWQHADMQANMRSEDEDMSVEIHIAHGDSTTAIAFATYWSNDYNARDLFIAAEFRDDRIVAYRWMDRPSEQT